MIRPEGIIKPVKPYDRGRQVLQLLVDHGPLSIRGVQALMPEPYMDRRRVRDVLHRLHWHRLVKKRNDNIFRGAAVFYEITENPKGMEAVAVSLGVSVESLDRPYPRHQELIHWEECGLWAEKFKRMFPGAEVIRDYQFARDPRVENWLLTERNEFESLPDLLVVIPKTEAETDVVIAVEIEKKRKSAGRLYKKLRKYATATRLDGVLYICDSDSIMRKLDIIFRSRVLQSALRIKHYGQNFLMFNCGAIYSFDINSYLRKCNAHWMELSEWVKVLQGTSRFARRDHMFADTSLQGLKVETPEPATAETEI